MNGTMDTSDGKRMVKVLTGLIIILAAIFVGWVIITFYGWGSSSFPSVDSSAWQAVFLTNNQVYFGHLKELNSGYLILEDIYYLRVDNPLQVGSPPPPPQINLVKLGGELHGPQDMMYIPKDKVMFWENMSPDSQVVQAISNFLQSQGQ